MIKKALALAAVCWSVADTTGFVPSSTHRQQPVPDFLDRRRRTAGSAGPRQPSAPPRVVLFDVPPPAEGTIEFTEYASKLSPPQSFYELQQDSIRATRLARKDGHKLLEVEFPPLPANVLEMDDVSTYDVLRANLRLVVDYAKGLLASDDSAAKIAVLLPDQAEVDFAVEKLGTANPVPGVSVVSIRQSDPDSTFKPEQWLIGLFGRNKGSVKAIPGTDIYICVGLSAQELPDVEELYEQDPDKTIVFFNMKLDILRGDLGAPAFPPKDFQDRFLSRVKPVYYLRTRQYTRSTPNPPFMVNFQGCLFRSYPGVYQTLLDTGMGRYRRVKGNAVRPALGAFKKELTDALIEKNVLQDEGSTLNFLRTGYKTTTWWEEDREMANDAWRT
jgi:hypothetical protein